MSVRRLHDPRFLIAHYPLNGHAEDLTGGNDGTWSGDESYEDNLFGIQAGQFDGTGDFINIDDLLANELASLTVGSFAFWIKPTDGTPAALQNPLAFGDTDGNAIISTRMETDGKLNLRVRSVAGGELFQLKTDSAVFKDGIYTHVICSTDAVTPKLYIDGEFPDQTFTTDIDRSGWFSTVSTLDNGRIGNRNVNAAGEINLLNGALGSLRFYNVGLTAPEAAALFKLEHY